MAVTLTRRQKIAGGAGAAVIAAAAITGGVIASSGGSTETVYACVRSDGLVRADTVRVRTAPPASCPSTSDHIVHWSADVQSAPPSSTTTTSRPPAPTTTVTTVPPGPTTTTVPPPPPASLAVCGVASMLNGPTSAPAGAVTIPAGNNASTLAGTRPASTTYWLAPGTHTLGSGQYDQIIPGNGDTFIGAPGAVIDGQRLNAFAFTQHATNVTIRNLTIKGFIAPLDQGVVNHDSGNNWTVQGNTITLNDGAALMAGANNVIRDNCLSTNGQYGINAYQAGDGITNLIVDHNEIVGNNTGNWEALNAGCGCTGGVKFWAVNGATVTNNWVHANLSVGLWADTNNRNFVVTGNRIESNDSVGFFYEISYGARVQNNVFVRNGLVAGPKNPGFPTGAIYLSESGGDPRVANSATIDISGNTFTDNWSGVILWENSDRFCGSAANTSSGYCTLVNPGVVTAATCNATNIANPPYYSDCRWKTQNVSVHDNAFNLTAANVSACAASKGCGFNGTFAQWGSYPAWSPYQGTVVEQAIALTQNNVFASNTYRGPWGWMAPEQGHVIDWNTWRGTYHQDAGSTLAP